MELTAGSRWHSAVCETEVVVVKAPGSAVTLECGGAPVVPLGEDAPAGLSLDPAHSGGTQMGKRFADTESGLEVLASKPGAGSLSVNGTPLPLKDAKPLPASD